MSPASGCSDVSRPIASVFSNEDESCASYGLLPPEEDEKEDEDEEESSMATPPDGEEEGDSVSLDDGRWSGLERPLNVSQRPMMC